MENFPSNFVEGFLELHNEYRTIHGSPPLQIDDKLNEPAQEWAERLARKAVIQYRSVPDYGENIYLGYSRTLPYEIKPKDPLEAWYQEGKYFPYGKEDVGDLEGVRHFTQLIWKSSKLIGLGMSSDSDGKVYFVCLYQPPGNIAGQFADNVLQPPQEEDMELSELEAQQIRVIEAKPNVVKSMERLYAVPSEQLRVWTIWLTKVGDIADEWQRWLRAHIDFVTRLAEQLMAAEEVLSQVHMEIDQLITVADQPITVADQPITVADQPITVADQPDKEVTGEDSDFDLDKFEAASEITVIKKSTITIIPAESSRTLVERAEWEEEEGKEKREKEEEKEVVKLWPIGIPWVHLGQEDVDDKEPFERLPLPRNEDEMRQFLKNFTHQATVYRTYYKHWRETADEAIKEVGCRMVLPTYVVQGKDADGCIKKPPCLRSPKPKRKRPCRGARRRMAKKLSRKSKAKRSIKSAGSKESAAVSSKSKTTIQEGERTEPSTESTEEPPDEATGESSKLEMEETEEGKEKVAKKSVSKASKSSKVSTRTGKSVPVEASDLVRDCARAEEPVPYNFYAKAEPDIDIAIEHDDQVVIEEDTDRENVVGDYKQLFFNLTDKPCKGGKPWIL